MMINICVEKRTTLYLKEDLGHFRNLCQHTNMTMLENVLKNLRNQTEKIISEMESKYGQERLGKILTTGDASHMESLEYTGGLLASSPEDLIFKANCCMDEIEEKAEVMPNVAYLFEIYKAIMDSLRQNSKMMDFYNTTAQRAFDFCRKYDCHREYKKISETLHSHFAQIIK